MTLWDECIRWDIWQNIKRVATHALPYVCIGGQSSIYDNIIDCAWSNTVLLLMRIHQWSAPLHLLWLAVETLSSSHITVNTTYVENSLAGHTPNRELGEDW